VADPAPPAARLPVALSILGLAAAVAGLLLLFYSQHLFCPRPAVIAVQVAAALLMIWARITFGRRSFHAAANPTAGGLVTSGPYRYWRHPIYAAILYFAWASLGCGVSALGVAGAALITVGLGLRMAMEERLLRRMYPGYVEYAARTRRVVPFLL
jgi:protein-S-isoprenylcysteine O-methyltransferase Ste14